MNPIIEQVAKAIYEASTPRYTSRCTPWEGLDSLITQAYYASLAEAAIEAFALHYRPHAP